MADGGGGLFGGIASAVSGITHDFNYKAQENELAIAQANAQAALAQANAPQQKNNTVLYVITVVVVVVIVVLFRRKK